MGSDFRYMLSGCAPELYPVDTFFGLLYYSANDAAEIPKRYPYKGTWGHPESFHLLEKNECPMPGMIDVVWLSIVERKFYSHTEPLPVRKFEEIWNATKCFDQIVVGFAPFGRLALWFYGAGKSSLQFYTKAEEIHVPMKDFLPSNPDMGVDEYCDFYINNDSAVKKNLQTNGLPPHDLFDNYMKQFTYRYQVLMEKWRGEDEEVKWEKYKEDEEKAPEFDWIEEALFDGTHDKLHDGGLMQYHEAGKPKKLAMQFHRGKTEYTAYFWFDDEMIREVFDRFYGAHPQTKTDFIIRIDAEQRKYELALYRYGLKEPVKIKEDVYQLIVFKNRFEDYRSENYNQPRGAWNW